ncbi:hypothetical protein [Streptomyces cuspidosporus]|uniref:hypothetical protein n=1 Tax=Streptomyces cuspidosporus TaxID=66882 RepID=UPI0031FE198A
MPSTDTKAVPVHDPAKPAGASPEPTPAVSYEGALERVQRVLAWYNEQILSEARTAVPDEARVKRLKAERQACVADQRALEDADDAEVSRIAAAYDARFRELTEP